MADEISFHVLADLDLAAREALTRRAEADLDGFVEKARPIIAAVRDEGDRALSRFAKEFDRSPVEPDAIAVKPEEIDRAWGTIGAETREVLEFAVHNVRRFHEAQMPENMWLKEMSPGVFAGDRVTPIESVACYVPRGKGEFPSVAMMTAVPAVVAGVPRPVIVTPPGPSGDVDPGTLVVARLAGVERVYKCGGAQAVAAVAYGTETVPRCLKIVGPGSPWVVAAKRLLVDRIDPGPPAGPSESIVLADGTANGKVCALDLLVEAEHGPDSSAYLVTPSREVAEAARAFIPECWAKIGEIRVAYSKAVLCGPRGGIVLARDTDDAIAFTNGYAPEHLQVHSKEPWRYLSDLRDAGEILLGEHASIPLGNFVLGPNAVLPTGGAARTRSPLSVFDYLKRTSIGHVTREGFERLAPVAKRFAEYEGFDAHALALSAMRGKAFGA